MDWIQFAIFFVGVFGLFIWNRSEGRADARHMDAKLEFMRSLQFAIHEEVKDFHSRMYILEERGRK